MSLFKKILIDIAITIVVIAIIFGYLQYQDQITTYVNNIADGVVAYFTPAPCSKPILYSLGTVDDHFGMTKEQFTVFIKQAITAWELASDRILFQKITSVNDNSQDILRINLIYDYRQQATEEMASLGIVIKDDKNTYDTLKAKYDSLFVTYQREKAEVQVDLDAFTSRKKAYDDQVKYWNSQGGAPATEFSQLEQERTRLNAIATALNNRQKIFNSLVDTLNSVVTIMNRLANELKLNVKTYNTIGSSTGEEFSEGEYVSDSAGRRVNIYQFSDTDQLVRVLEHELGHALGLGHVKSPGSIMYRLNDGTGKELSADDIAELKFICKIK